MRTLRLSLVGTVVLMLLGGMSGMVAGKDTGPAPVTGTVLTKEVDDSEEEWWAEPMHVGHARAFNIYETWEWSDPRLPADMSVVLNFDMHDIGSFREMLFSSAVLLVGPEGYWTGTSTDYLDQEGLQHGVEILTGHDAYDGLLATLHVTSGPDEVTRSEGLIFEATEMPPLPDPIEPPAE